MAIPLSMGWNCVEESSYELSSSPVGDLAGGEAWQTQVRDCGYAIIFYDVPCFQTALLRDLPLLLISSYGRRGLWPMEHKSHPSTYQRAGSCRVPSMERSNFKCGTRGCWIQPLSSLANLRGGAGGSAECRQERTGCGGRTVQRLLQVGL